jgi:hypothetical protein
MLVDRLCGEPVLIPFEAFSEVVLSNEFTPDEQIEGTVDGRLSKPMTIRPERTLDLID